MIGKLAVWQATTQRYTRLFPVRIVFLLVLLMILVFISLSAVSTGAVRIQRDVVFKVSVDAIAEKLHLDYDSGLDYTARCLPGQSCIQRDAALIREIRWPRVIMAGLVGASLAIAGTALQGALRNPLADPGLIGASSGAAVGAVTAILLGVNIGDVLHSDAPALARLTQSLFAFTAALITTFGVFRLARWQGRTDSTSLLLIGLAINTMASAFIGLATFISDIREVNDIVFWTLGSFAEIFWRDVYVVVPFTVLSVVILPFLARQLNLMTLGEAEAQHLGVNAERLRMICVALAAMTVGVSVAFAGIIGFVGLVVPHLIRFFTGPDHRIVLPASVLTGAILMIAADLWARTVAIPTEVPVGIVTALFGGPVFLVLIILSRRGRG
ncbi:MAG: iron ABC transporter permease [Chloroflexi bacterium]|nr:iron ABC transporter permease [Chloroflexota bacterium]